MQPPRGSASRASPTSRRSRATRTSFCGAAAPSASSSPDGGVYDWEQILALVEPGGFIVKDDLTPGRAVDGDPVREFLLRDPRLAAVEILTAPGAAAIVAVKRT